MSPETKAPWVSLGATGAALAVIAGAFGAHALAGLGMIAGFLLFALAARAGSIRSIQ